MQDPASKFDRESLQHTVINIVGSLLPLILSLFAIIIFSDKSLYIPDLIGKGEISIICVPLAISVLYGLSSVSNLRNSSKYSFIFWGTLLFLILGTFSYAMQYRESADSLGSLVTELNNEIINSPLIYSDGTSEGQLLPSEQTLFREQLNNNLRLIIEKSSSDWNLGLTIFSVVFLLWITWSTYQAKLVEVNPEALTTKRKDDVDQLDESVKKRK